MKPVAVALCLALAGATQAWAQTENPAWLDDVQAQLAEEKACEVAFYIRVQEDKLGGVAVYKARAQCVDGRQFDASRKEGDARFDIQACTAEVC